MYCNMFCCPSREKVLHLVGFLFYDVLAYATTDLVNMDSILFSSVDTGCARTLSLGTFASSRELPISRNICIMCLYGGHWIQ